MHRTVRISSILCMLFAVGALLTSRGTVEGSSSLSAHAQSEIVLHLFDQLCQGEWYGGYEGAPFPEWPKRLPCPGLAGDNNGFVRKLSSNDTLEDGSEGSRTIETYPTMRMNGFIRGTFALNQLRLTLQSGDRFVAQVGFVEGMTDARARFMVIYDPDPIESGDEQQLTDISKSYDGKLRTIDLDLSRFAGQSGDLILRVETAGEPNQDRAVWVKPRILRPQPPTPVPSPTSTRTPTRTPTAPPVITASPPPTLIPTPTPTTTPDEAAAMSGCEGTTIYLKADPMPNQFYTFTAAASPECPLEYLVLWVDHEMIKECFGAKCAAQAGPFPEGFHLFDAYGLDDQGKIVFPGNVVIEGESVETLFDHIGDPIQNCPLCPELPGFGECTAQICTGDDDPNYYVAGGAQIQCEYEGMTPVTIEFDIPAFTALLGEDSIGPYTDTCLDDTTLAEFFCQGTGGLRELHYDCPIGCADGACIPCRETDGGYDLDVYGEIIDDPYQRADYCISDVGLMELVCIGNEIFEYQSGCQLCRDGACQPCTDSDGGKNYGVQGVSPHGAADVCMKDVTLTQDPSEVETLKEYYTYMWHGICKTDWEFVDCPGGCEDGACLPSCADGIQNGNEQGVDCGGSCPASCLDCWDPLDANEIQDSVSIFGPKYFSFADPLVQQAAYDALAEYADCLRSQICRFRLRSVIPLEDYSQVTVFDLQYNTDAIMEASALYVTQHMGYLSDVSSNQIPTKQSAAWTVRESGSRGCTANMSLFFQQQGSPADYCGDCEDFAILRETLIRVLGVSEDCAYCADIFDPNSIGLHTHNLVLYRGKWRIMDYRSLGESFLAPKPWRPPYNPENVWNDHIGRYWCQPGHFGCFYHPSLYTWNYLGGDHCPATYSPFTFYIDVCP